MITSYLLNIYGVVNHYFTCYDYAFRGSEKEEEEEEEEEEEKEKKIWKASTLCLISSLEETIIFSCIISVNKFIKSFYNIYLLFVQRQIEAVVESLQT